MVKNRRLLLVDDDPALLNMSSKMLAGESYEITTASCVAEGLAAFQKINPGVILTDLQMPDGTGVELAEKVRAENRTVQIIILTGAGSVQSGVRALEIGTFDYLLKPVARIDLTESVMRAFKRFDLISERAAIEVRPSEADISLEQEVQSRTEQIEKMAQQILRIQDKERLELASELHDSMGQTLASLKLGLSMFRRDVREDQQARVAEFIQGIDEVIARVRALSRELAPFNRHSTMASSIQQMLAEIESKRLFKTRFDLTAIENCFGKKWSTDYFRIVQQLLSNVIAHAQATEITLDTELTPELLILRLTDNGIGIQSSPKRPDSGFGLSLIQRRTNALGGTFDAHEIRDHENRVLGTFVKVAIPVKTIENLTN